MADSLKNKTVKGVSWSAADVDIDKYAEKLYDKAQRIEIWEDGHLEGLY